MSVASTECERESDRPPPTPKPVNDIEEFLRAIACLNDSNFYADPISACSVPAAFQIDLLRDAHRLAQETLWHALRLHWPSTQRQFYLETWKQVSFGFDDMRGLLKDEGWLEDTETKIGQPRHYLIDAIKRVIDLRNAVSHNNVVPNDVADELMRRAQVLAIILQDSGRATEIRRLRDDLQLEIRNSQKMVETYFGCTSHPTWPVHIQKFFSNVMWDLSVKNSKKRYPEVVEQAAKEWSRQYSKPGEEKPVYLETLRFARAFKRRGGSGRHVSFKVQMMFQWAREEALEMLEEDVSEEIDVDYVRSRSVSLTLT